MTDTRADPPQVPSEIRALVARYHEHRETYEQQTYNETQARREFIDPFFAALGWDIDNRAGLAEAYKDVIHEDAIKIGGATKAPDYCFRIGGTRKFFVEAKKPSIGVSNDPGPAYQVRRYAWTSKLPLSIVTDFQEFAVYDCRIPPKPNDKATVARIFYCTFDQYAEKWPEIASIFSKDAVLKGSFDKYAESKKRKKGTAEVDAEFLREIEDWREALAKNFALRNDDLSVRDLNFAVERTIDRIIFLRMCEDRGIEPYGRLQSLLNGSAIYERLAALFREADDKYNAGLFYFRQEADRGPPDELTLALTLDDKILKQIIARLYYPESPYEFSVLPTEILGQVYEQFLGKVIRLTAGHRAVIEEKPEVRKAGGVYYTPTYIVDYIVKNTVGKLLEGKTPADVGPERETKTGKTKKLAKGAKMLRVLDPACGSGSFLLGAYQFLLDWHRDYYVSEQNHAREKADEPSRDREGAGSYPTTVENPLPHGRGSDSYKDRLYQGPGGHWRLTIREKKRILLNNIYGVDIDPQAVEVTKLSLLLKVLEGETAETIGSTLRLFHERALPDLSHNIKCGNSLIGPDFYEGRQMDMFDEEERQRINVFDWHAEFPDVFPSRDPTPSRAREEAGSDSPSRTHDQAPSPDSGFDAVIGNPPYIRVRILREFVPAALIEYMQLAFKCATHVWDIYLLFLEKAVALCRSHGRLSFIIPIQTLHQPNCQSIRQLLVDRTHVAEIADLSGIRVFAGPIVKNCVIVCEKSDRGDRLINTVMPANPADLIAAPRDSWPQKAVHKNPGYSLKLDMLSSKRALCEKLIEGSWLLNQLCYVTFGLRSCAKGKGQGGKERLITSDQRNKTAKPYLEGRDISRYNILWPGKYIKYLPDEMYSPRTPRLFESKKIISQTMLSRMRLIATLDHTGYFVEQSLLCIVPHGLLTDDVPLARPSLEFILGVLNSRLESFYFGAFVIDHSLGGGLIHATPGSQAQLVIPRTDSSHESAITELVSCLLSYSKSLVVAKTDHDKTALQRQIDSTDKQIDQLVYQLYGLTDDEVRIVEEATK